MSKNNYQNWTKEELEKMKVEDLTILIGCFIYKLCKK